MDDMIEISFKTLTNSDIGRVLGFTEGTIRHAKKKSLEKFKTYQNKAIKRIYPFVEYDDFFKKNRKIKKRKKEIPFFIKRETVAFKESETVYLPYNILESFELKDEYREFKKCNVISIANNKGGVAKTTNSLNIASVLSMYGYNILFIDYDTQANASQSLQLRPKINIKKSIVDLVLEVGKGKLNKKELQKYIISVRDNFHAKGKFDIIPNAGDTQTQEKAISIAQELIKYSTSYKALDLLLNMVKDEYDFVIIDTPPNDLHSLSMITNATDYFVFSFKPEKYAAEGTGKMFATLKEELEMAYKMNKNKTINIIGGIISDYNNKINAEQDLVDRIEEDFSNYIQRYNLPKTNTIFNQKIAHLQKFKKIQDSRQLGSLISPNSLIDKMTTAEMKAIRDYMDIATELVERIIIDSYKNEIDGEY